jgi:LPPG:FO 2-phospho-L-lactate transferase
MAAIASAELIVIAPSNPFVSVAPILSTHGVLDALDQAQAHVIAVSPIVSGEALRGPAASMISALGGEATATGIANHFGKRYPGLVDVLVVDEADSTEADRIRSTGIRPHVAPTVMVTEEKRRRLAQEILVLAGAL